MKWLSVLQSHARVPDSAQVCIDYRSHNKIVSAFQVKSNQGNRKQACENRCDTAHLAVAVDLQRSFNKAGHHCAVQASFCFRNPCRCKRSPGRNGSWRKRHGLLRAAGLAKQLLLLRFRLPCRGSSTTWFQCFATLKIPLFLVCLLKRRFLDRMTSSDPQACVHRII